MRVILTGGGTGGHIYPALSIANALKKQHRDVEILYVGSADGLEHDIVGAAGLPFKSVEISGFRRSLSVENIKTMMRFLSAIRKAKVYVREFKPDVVIGTGGYVCAPVVYAAAKLGIKTLIHEQNSLPGMTNKFLAKYVDKVAVCFKEAKQYFHEDQVVLTGNPRASEVANTLKIGKAALGLNPHKKTVIISGGSRGAAPINDAFISEIAKYEKADFEVVFVTGSAHYERIIAQIEGFKSLKNVQVRPFIDKMPQFLVSADLFVGRSGSTFLSEITALGVPSILIPSPYVTENHQEFNARSVTDHGGGVLILEQDLTGEHLFLEISKILHDSVRLKSMSSAAKALGIPDAADRLIAIVNDLV